MRRNTERAGAVYVAVQLLELERLERELIEPPQGPALQQVLVDGALVPRVCGQQVIHTTELSYYSGLTDSDTFGRVAGVELHRRCTETAGRVLAVVD